jgi:hypothetical protein
LRATGEPVGALVQQSDEFGGVPEGIGDRARGARGGNRCPQLPSDLGDQDGPGWHWFGIQSREASHGSGVLGMGKADGDAETLVERGAADGPGATPSFGERL